jgi:uncharacterized lipoprotein YajG
MRIPTVIAALLVISACASTPETPEQLATKRFNDCMDSTLPSFVHVTVATADQRIKAAEVCRTVMLGKQDDAH